MSASMPTPTSTSTSTSNSAFCIAIGTYERLLYGVDVILDKTSDATAKAESTADVARMENSFIMPVHAGCISAVATGGKFLASGASDDTIKLFDMRRRKEFGVISPQERSITLLAFYKQSFMFSAGEDGRICIYRCKDWELVKTLKASKSARINDFSLHPSGRMGISLSRDRTIVLWDLSAGKALTRSKTQSEPLRVKYSVVGNLYAILHSNSKIEVYDLCATDLLAADIQGASKTHAVVFYNETHLLFGGEDKCIYIYSFKTKETLQVQTDHTLRIRELLVHGDASGLHVLVSGSSDGGIRIWAFRASDNKVGLELVSIGRHSIEARVTCMAISSTL